MRETAGEQMNMNSMNSMNSINIHPRGIQYKDTFYGVYLKGIEPIFVKVKETKKCKSTHEYGLFYPITRTKHKIYLFLQWKYLRYIKPRDVKKCVFCSEAPATRTMPDPNYDSDLILDVCPDCIKWVFDCQLQAFTHFMDYKTKVKKK